MKKYALFLIVCFCALLSNGFAAEPVGEIIALEGSAVAVRSDVEHELNLKSAVFLNDRIITRSGSKLQIMFLDDTIVAQGEDAEMTIDEYIYTPAEKSENASSFGFVKGIFRNITGKITDLNPDRFKVKTKMATIGIRGCDLFFDLRESAERIFIVRVPESRLIRVERDTGASVSETMDVRQNGVVVSLMPGQRMHRRPMSGNELKALLDQSTPRSSRGSRGSDESESDEDNGDEDNGGEDNGGEDNGDEDNGDDNAGQDDQAGDDGDGLSGGQEGAGEDNQFNGDSGYDSSGDQSGSDTGGGATDGSTDGLTPDDSALDDNVIDNPDPPPDPTPDPDPDPDPKPDPKPDPTPTPPPSGISGRGLGAEYSTESGYYSMRKLYRYDTLDGSIKDNVFDGSLAGMVFNRDGTVVGSASSRLSDLVIIPYGGSTYEGYIENARTITSVGEDGVEMTGETGQYLAYDNLGQFFRYTDMANPEMRFAYGGYSSSRFGVVLPENMLIKYDLKSLELDRDYFYGSAPMVRHGGLLINTKTGAYMAMEEGNDLAHFGNISEIEFFGQEMQGVGLTDVDFIAAGFRDNKTPGSRPESGSDAYRGYAVAMKARPLSPEYEMSLGLYRSADERSDSSDSAQNRVFLGINKDSPGDNVRVDINVYTDPGSPESGGHSLKEPSRSFFVKGKRSAAMWDGPDGEMTSEMQTTGGGMDWTWGMWESGIESESGSDRFDGFFVAGNTLSESAFQAIANGPMAYSLSTPENAPGMAAAYILHGYQVSRLDGVCYLNVNVPGNGAAPRWDGNFDMYEDYGTRVDSLQFAVADGRIGPNGHLHGDLSSYSLVLDGITHGSDTISSQGVTGNLVGSGSGDNPITGAIGQFNMTHGTGPQVNGVFGTDFISSAARASGNIHYAPE